ncbi:hypothetical protein SPV_2468 [Streptococcus pneumoniae]|nr:hypothetical protein SPV_2468 [Streptococcus pneumoniae]
MCRNSPFFSRIYNRF